MIALLRCSGKIRVAKFPGNYSKFGTLLLPTLLCSKALNFLLFRCNVQKNRKSQCPTMWFCEPMAKLHIYKMGYWELEKAKVKEAMRIPSKSSKCQYQCHLMLENHRFIFLWVFSSLSNIILYIFEFASFPSYYLSISAWNLLLKCILHCFWCIVCKPGTLNHLFFSVFSAKQGNSGCIQANGNLK